MAGGIVHETAIKGGVKVETTSGFCVVAPGSGWVFGGSGNWVRRHFGLVEKFGRLRIIVAEATFNLLKLTSSSELKIVLS